MDEIKPLIYGQISKVMNDLDAVTKSRRNKDQNFDFRGIDDVLNALHPLLSKHGVFIVPEVLEEKHWDFTTKSGSILHFASMRIKYWFYASDGSSISGVAVGEAQDSGDKSSGKAQSAAMKTVCIHVFAIPTENAPEIFDRDEEQRPPPTKPKIVKNEQALSEANQIMTWIYPFDLPVKFKGQALCNLGVDGILQAGKYLGEWKSEAAKNKGVFPPEAEKFLVGMRKLLQNQK